MKKILRVLLALILMISLTGCVKYNVNMEVKEDKSVTLEIIYAMEMDSSFLETEEDDYWNEEDEYWDEEDEYWDEEDEYWDEEDDYLDEEDDTSVDVDDYAFLESKGFKVEEFTEEKDDATLSGVKITKTYKNIDDISKDNKIIVDFNEKFGEEDTFDDSQLFYKNGNKYVANFIFDFSEEGDDTDYSAYQDMFDLEYKIKLPKKAISNNATSVSKDGKELTWELKYGEKNEVNFEFSFEDNNLMLIIILSLGGIAVLIGVLTIVITSSKEKKNKSQPPMSGMQDQNQNMPIQNPNIPNTTIENQNFN